MFAHANMMKRLSDFGIKCVLQTIMNFFQESFHCENAEIMAAYTDRAVTSGTLPYENYLPFCYSPTDKQKAVLNSLVPLDPPLHISHSKCMTVWSEDVSNKVLGDLMISTAMDAKNVVDLCLALIASWLAMKEI